MRELVVKLRLNAKEADRILLSHRVAALSYFDRLVSTHGGVLSSTSPRDAASLRVHPYFTIAVDEAAAKQLLSQPDHFIPYKALPEQALAKDSNYFVGLEDLQLAPLERDASDTIYTKLVQARIEPMQKHAATFNKNTSGLINMRAILEKMVQTASKPDPWRLHTLYRHMPGFANPPRFRPETNSSMDRFPRKR